MTIRRNFTGAKSHFLRKKTIMISVLEDPSAFYAAFARGAKSAESYSAGMVDLASLASRNAHLFPEAAEAVIEAVRESVVYQVKGAYRKGSNGISVFIPSTPSRFVSVGEIS